MGLIRALSKHWKKPLERFISKNLPTRSLPLLALVFIFSPSIVFSQAGDRAELDTYEIPEYFIPSTTREQAAYAFNLTSLPTNTNDSTAGPQPELQRQTVVPCENLQVRYSQAFGRQAWKYSEMPDTDPSIITAEEYRNLGFLSLRDQYMTWNSLGDNGLRRTYRFGDRFYLLPLRAPFVTDEEFVAAKLEEYRISNGLASIDDIPSSQRKTLEDAANADYLVESRAYGLQYPEGKFVGFLKYKTALTVRPLDLENDRELLQSRRYHAVKHPFYEAPAEVQPDKWFGRAEWGFDAHGGPVGTDRVLPTIFFEHEGTFAGQWLIAEESCVNPTLHYLDENYSDVQSALSSDIEKLYFFAGGYGLSFSGQQPSQFDYSQIPNVQEVIGDRPPVELGFWLAMDGVLDEINDNINPSEFVLEAIKTRFYFHVFGGTILAANDLRECKGGTTRNCWADGLSLGSDILRDTSYIASEVLTKKLRTPVIIAGGIRKAQKVASGIRGLNKFASFNAAANYKAVILGLQKYSAYGFTVSALLDGGLGTYYAFLADHPDYWSAAGRVFSGVSNISLIRASKHGILPIPIRLKKNSCEPLTDVKTRTIESNASEFTNQGNLPERLEDAAGGIPEIQAIADNLKRINFRAGCFNDVQVFDLLAGVANVIKSPKASWGDPSVLADSYVELSKVLRSIIQEFPEHFTGLDVPEFARLPGNRYSTSFINGRTLPSKVVREQIASGNLGQEAIEYERFLKYLQKFEEKLSERFKRTRALIIPNLERKQETVRLYKLGEDPSTGEGIYFWLDVNAGNLRMRNDGTMVWIDPPAIVYESRIGINNRGVDRTIFLSETGSDIRGVVRAGPLSEDITAWATLSEQRLKIAESLGTSLRHVGELPDGTRALPLGDNAQHFAAGVSADDLYKFLWQQKVPKSSNVLGDGLYGWARNGSDYGIDPGLQAAIADAQSTNEPFVMIGGFITDSPNSRASRPIAQLVEINPAAGQKERLLRGHVDLSRPDLLREHVMAKFSALSIDRRLSPNASSLISKHQIVIRHPSNAATSAIQILQIDSGGNVSQVFNPVQFMLWYEQRFGN